MRNYELFMRDYIKENSPDDYSLLPEVEQFDEAGRDDVYKENYYFQDNLQIPFVKQVLTSQKNRDAIIDFVGRFIDEHMKQLTTSGPVYIFTFADKETAFLYKLFNVNADQLITMYTEMVNATYNGEISKFFTGWVKNAPHKLLLTAMIAESVQSGYNDIIECCEYMYAFTEYPIIYRNYWKIGVNEEVMNYTIEHLGAKFKIRQLKNLMALLKYDSTKAVEFYKGQMNPCPDNVYMDMMYRIRNQINSKFRNISRAYFKNIEKNAAQHANVTEFDDGQLADQEGHATTVSSIIDKTVSKFASGEVNKGIVRLVANKNQTDRSNLEGMIGNIFTTKNNRVQKFVENIITAYFNKYPDRDNLMSTEFLNYGLALYRSIGTSKDELFVEMKEILNMWMNDIIHIADMYQREPTRIAYRRSIFDYIIFMINYYN